MSVESLRGNGIPPTDGVTRRGEVERQGGDLVGRGWAFPGRITAYGGVALDDARTSTESAIRMILSTAPGERVMRPDFGCALWEQVFAPVDAGTLGLVEKAVRDALARWEPRIDVEDVEARPSGDRDRIDVVVRYVVRATNDRRNLVYPFYVIPSEEGGTP
jgi:phage baseplate assembly protein W